MKENFVKSPFNYTGGKYKLLPQIFPHFPENIKVFHDVFTGGGSVGLNAKAHKVNMNDIDHYLMEMFSYFKLYDYDTIYSKIQEYIDYYGLTKTNKEGYVECRKDYNKEKNPILLYTLLCFSFNYQIRYNKKGDFNMPFGKDRSSFNKATKEKLKSTIEVMHNKNIELFSLTMEQYFNNVSIIKEDFVYVDPPYLITDATYNVHWSADKERKLLGILDTLNDKGIRFALSNVMEHKGNINNILLEWSKGYEVIDLNYNYNNCSYHTKRLPSREVLIINY